MTIIENTSATTATINSVFDSFSVTRGALVGTIGVVGVVGVGEQSIQISSEWLSSLVSV